MRVIIAGSRTITDKQLVEEAIKASAFEITEVVSGGAIGVDRMGEKYADMHNIPVKMFRADWKKWGVSAGAIRNKEMARYADALIAVWDGVSPGTRMMIEFAKELNLKVFVYEPTSHK